MDILISIVAKIGESLVVPVGRQFGYLIDCNKNIENLRHQLQILESLRNDVQRSIQAESRNGYVIRDVVKHWTERVDVVKPEAIKILEDDVNVNKRCFNGCFPDLVTLYQLGKEAKMKTMEIAKLQEDSKFGNISNPAPSSRIESMCSRDFVNYDTTRLATAKVMEALEDDNITLIGIHSMGGVGKTTLVKEIGRNAKEEKLFDEVVMTVVSQNVIFKKIQDDMADMLGLTFKKQSDNGRATELRDRMRAVNKILVILDDVWSKFEVATVGIPFGNDHKGCKIVITTRRAPVCRAMGMGIEQTKIVQLECLSKQDSWDLFGRNVGNVVNSPTLNLVAKEIAEECRGLPIALVTVGRAMRNKEQPEEWKEAAEELRKSVPTNIEDVDVVVYRCIKLSYDYLRDDEAKSCFLLCSLFPEDRNILIETLVRYGVGLEIFKNVDSVQDARRRANSVINNLKASSLLLASEKEGSIKMHDVVRDVAISIGSNKYLVRAGRNLEEWPNRETLYHYTGMSLMSNQIDKVPDVWERSNLQLMLLQENRRISWTSSFFEGMKALRVLDLSYNGEISSSSSFCYLTSLQTLILQGLRIGNTSFLRQIKTLEVLSFRGSKFYESPVAIRELTNLRLLDMSSCQHDPDSIPGIFVPNMISCLSSCLEELYLSLSIRIHGLVFDYPTRIEWKVAAELKSLRRLTFFFLNCIDDVKDAPEDFVFPDLDSFCIYLQPLWNGRWRPNYLEIDGSSSSMIWWQKCFKVLLKRTNYLHLHHLVDVKNIVDLLFDGEGLNALKTLSILTCPQLEYFIDDDTAAATQQNENHWQVLSNLEELVLDKLDNFKGIFSDGVLLLPNSTVSQLLLPKLRSLQIAECPVRFTLTRVTPTGGT